MSEQQIPGVPAGFRLARIDYVKHGEPYLEPDEPEPVIWADDEPSQGRYVVLEYITKPKEYEAAILVPLSKHGAYDLSNSITCRVPWNETKARNLAKAFPDQVTIREKGTAS